MRVNFCLKYAILNIVIVNNDNNHNFDDEMKKRQYEKYLILKRTITTIEFAQIT